jgi:sporulation protein YlmC with PRC-barrel domain
MKFLLKKKLLIAALVPAFGMPFAVLSIAQTAESQGAKTGQSQEQKSTQRQQGQRGQQAAKIRDMRASKIIGADVQSAKGEQLGDVKDLIVNADDGKVNYAIVAFGGVLGFGEKLFAYPMDRFQPSSDGSKLVLNASEEEMKNAPGFDRSAWPTWGRGGYRGEVEKHFGQTAQAGGDLLRMSDMLNNKVVDRSGKEVGQVEDAVVSVRDGKVRYVALEPDKDLNMGDRLVMLPMTAIRATGEQQVEKRQQAQERQPGQPQQPAQARQQQQQQQQAQRQDQDLQLVLNIEPRQLQKARAFRQDQWPNLNDQAFQREMDSYVAAFPSGARAGTSAGATGTQGQTGTGGAEPGKMQQDQPSKTLPAQEGTQQRQPETTGQSK